MTPKIIDICGSLKKEFYNNKLLNQAVAEFGLCSYREMYLSLRLYDGDLEDRECIPIQVKKLVDVIKGSKLIPVQIILK